MSITQNIKAARKKAGLSQEEIAKLLGIKTRTYGSYERGEREASAAFVAKFCKALSIPASDIFPSEKPQFLDLTPLKGKKYPLIGAVACGEPIVSESNEIFNFDDIDADFALRCKGDSMTGAKINDGDIVLIKQCPEVENGEIAAVAVDLDGECTLKKVYYDREKARLTLMPCNPSYEPIIIEGPALEDVRILGRAVVCVSKV